MATSQPERDGERMAVNRRLSNIREELEREREFQQFGASTDVDYRMSDARIAGLKAERSRLKEILGDLR